MSSKSFMFISLKIFKKYGYNNFLLPVTKRKTFLPYSLLNYSSGSEVDEMSVAMQAYLKRYKEKEQLHKTLQEEFEMGKKHLANIIGEEVQNLSQAKIDAAISYLFPSALFVPKSRPMMKSPSIIFKKESTIAFDSSGRPFHYLFYTSLPNFNEILHEASTYLERLIALEGNLVACEAEKNPEFVTGSIWISQKELENLCQERLRQNDYNKFLEVFNALVSHPMAGSCKNFIMKFRKPLSGTGKDNLIKPKVLPDGTMKILIKRVLRKSSSAKVLVTFPGTGLVKINNRDIDYFNSIQSREQVGKFRSRGV